MRPTILVLWALVGACAEPVAPKPAPPQQQPEPPPRTLEEACARWKCRPATEVRLQTKEGEPITRTFPAGPYTDGTLVQILPGESFAFTGDLQGDRLTHLRLVEGPAAERDALVVSFQQREVGGAPSMILKVESRFPRTLKYRAGMLLPQAKGIRTTSSCPVMAGKLAYETWPHPILVVYMKDITVVPEGGPMKCD